MDMLLRTRKNLLLILILLSVPFSGLIAQCSSSWLNLPGYYRTTPSGVQIGDLDITGNQLTVEATYSCDWNNTTARYNDLVSKHCSSSDANYLLRPYSAAITTTTGFYSVSFDIICFSTDRVFHTAMVYNGSTLEIYFNGILRASTPASGNLITNNLPARIGTEACNAAPAVDFIGKIYDVKIWNIARSETQIQSGLWTDLTNPTSQTGLQSYYKFNSLNNLQGNAAWNGNLLGLATIGNSNPYCNNTNRDPCNEPGGGPIRCDYFLNVNADFAGVSIGDLDLGGTQMTIEAIATRNTAYDPVGEGGDVVSKHSNAQDANYFLRPNAAAIRVGNRFYKISALCPAQVGKTYHLAMVWNGSVFYFYRNGQLQGSVNTITGNLGTNNWPARIGSEADQNTALPIHFNGYINEVRFWKTARTQQELLAYKDKMLPRPYGSGLIAYYIFNAYTDRVLYTFNGTRPFGPVGSVTLKTTTPDCSTVTTCNPTTLIKAYIASEEVVLEDFTINSNPTENKIQLKLKSKQGNLVTIKLFNMTGQLTALQKVAVMKGANSMELKTGKSLQPGMYVIQVEYPSKTIQRKLIIK